MGIREKREAEKKAAQGPAQQKPEDVKKKLDEKKLESEPLQPTGPGADHPMQMLDSKLRELKEARERSKADEKEDVGRVAMPVKTVYVESDEKAKPEESDSKKEETASDGTLVVPPKSKEQKEQIIANLPDAKLVSDIKEAKKRGKYDDALQKALQIKDKELKNQNIEEIADEYAKKGEFSEAMDIAEKIEDKLFRARVIMEFATHSIIEKSKTLNGDPKLYDKAEKILKEAKKTAKEVPSGKARSDIISDIENALDDLQVKKSNSHKYNEWKARRKKVAWIVSSAVGATVLAVLGAISQIYPDEIKAWVNGKLKAEKDNGSAVVVPEGDSVESAAKADFDALKEKYDIEEANRFPELKNEEIDPTVLSGQRKIEDIDADIKDVESMLETYEDGSKKKLNAKQEELVAGITKKYVEAKLQDPEIEDTEKDGLQLALEDAELLKGFEKEALQALLESLRVEATEAEKLKAYLGGEEVAEIMKADLCPVSEIDPSRVGNGVCDRNPVKKLVGKDGEVMYVSVPYDESEVCPTDCPKGKGGAKAAEIEIRRGG